MSAPRLAVLGYHRIGPPPQGEWESWYFVSRSAFSRHLQLVQEAGWTCIDADRFLTGLREPQQLPERALLITFDDGYRSMVEHALPCLSEHGIPSVLFVPSDHVGRRNTFDLAEPPEDICDWDDLRLLDSNGMAVESHAASHRAFSELAPEDRGAELERSKRAIEEQLGKAVRLFAYPFGDVGPDQERLEGRLADLGYEAAFLYPRGHVALPADNPYRLQRIAVGADTDVVGLLEAEFR